MDTILGGGASENHIIFKALVTLIVNGISRKHFSNEFLESLPMGFKTAFPHHNPEYGNHIKIFVDGEMPHCVKKFHNAMNSKRRDLTFRVASFNLALLEEIWMKICDSGVHGRTDLRQYKFGKENFSLKSYNKK